VDGAARVVRTPFVFVGNNDYIDAGLQLGGRTALDAGLLSVFIAPECGRFEILTLPVRALLGRLASVPSFEHLRAEAVTIEVARRRLAVALDGEVAMMQAPLRYRIRRGALRMIAPPAANAA
jgi:diacylglycerol kinase family enzyme